MYNNTDQNVRKKGVGLALFYKKNVCLSKGALGWPVNLLISEITLSFKCFFRTKIHNLDIGFIFKTHFLN